jgi:large subunit ribosomal protein L21
MELAVIKTGGKQYLVKKGDTFKIEKLEGVKAGDPVTFSEVLMRSNGDKVEIGTPTVSGEVKAVVKSVGRAQKIDVMKYKAKSRYHKRRGHRQPFVQVTITSL